MPKCPLCGGRKHIYRKGHYIKCLCLLKEEFDLKQSQAGIGSQFFDKSFGSFQLRSSSAIRAKSAAIKMARKLKSDQTPSRTVLFCGDRGTGKTLLASQILKASLRANRSSRLINLNDLLDIGSGSQKETFHSLLFYDIMCIELGIEQFVSKKAKDFAISLLCRLSRERENRGCYTFYTSRFDRRGISRRYGGEFSSMLDNSLVLVIKRLRRAT